MQIENVSLIEVIAAARGRHASLVVESTGYLMLGVVRAMGGRPMDVDARRIMLNTEGVVSLSGPRSAGSADEIARSLHHILRNLLDVSQGVGTALRGIASSPPPKLEGLFTGVSKALIPINRSAAKRALGRLARETVRARNRGQLAPEDLRVAAEALFAAPSTPADAAGNGADAPGRAPTVDARPFSPRPSQAAAPPPGQRTGVQMTQTPAPEMCERDEPEAWADIDANIELATPIPAPILNIELATPTPSPIALRISAPVSLSDEVVEEEFEVDCSLDDFEDDTHEARPDDSDDSDEAAAMHVGQPEPAPCTTAPRSVPDTGALPNEPAESQHVGAELEAAPAETEHEVAESVHGSVIAPDEDYAHGGPKLPAVVSGAARAPFIPVTPGPTPVVETPSPLGVTSGTPTIVDATLYRLTNSEIKTAAVVSAPEEAPADLGAAEDSSQQDAGAEPPIQDEAPAELASTDPEPDDAAECEAATDAQPRDEASPSTAVALSDDADASDEPGRVSAMSVQLPPAEMVGADEAISARSPTTECGSTSERAETVEGREDDTADDEGVDAEITTERARLSDIQQEARLVERLLAREQARVLQASPGSVEALLETFGDDSDADPVGEAAASLKKMMSLEPTPAPPVVMSRGEEPSASRAQPRAQLRTPPRARVPAPTPSPAFAIQFAPEMERHAIVGVPPVDTRECTTDPEESQAEKVTMEEQPISAPHYDDDGPMDVVPSVSPPPVRVADADPDMVLPRLTPTELDGKSPLAQRALFFGTTFLLAGVFVIGFLYWQHPHTLGLNPDRSRAAALGGATQPVGPCYADLTLKDLPAPHEVLLRLGQAPFTSRPLPTGVTLELIAMAPGHQAKRIIVPKGAAWVDGPDGMLTLGLAPELMPGETNGWPDAPAGEIGGIGPKGTIEFSAQPHDAEIWLVAGAGDGDRASVTVPCEVTAHILVLNPREPTKRRRLSVEPTMLEAARHAGGAELSVQP